MREGLQDAVEIQCMHWVLADDGRNRELERFES